MKKSFKEIQENKNKQLKEMNKIDLRPENGNISNKEIPN